MSVSDTSDTGRTGATIAVRATPRAACDRVVELDGRIRVYVTAVPENGKANAAIQKLLAKHLGVSKSRLTLLRGGTGRDKLFRLD